MMGHLPLGRVVATPGASNVLSGAGEDALRYLARHASGDWGDLNEYDRKENEQSLKHGLHVFSSYPVGTTAKIWIITEADRSVTTILLPKEY